MNKINNNNVKLLLLLFEFEFVNDGVKDIKTI